MPNFDEIAATNVGTSYRVKGLLTLPDGGNEPFELKVSSAEEHEIVVVGKCEMDP